MKIKFLYAALASVLFVSCYKAESLPETFESEYDFAIPLIDTTLHALENFPYFSALSVPPDDVILPAGLPLYSTEEAFPFFLGDWTEKGQIIRSVSPLLRLDGKDIPAGKARINIYTLNGSETNYFWLPKNYEINTADLNTGIKIIDEPLSENGLNAIKEAKTVYLEVSFVFNDMLWGRDLKTTSIHAKLGMRAQVRMALTTDL